MAAHADIEVLWPRKPGLAANPGNLNFDTRQEGVATPAFAHVFTNTTDRLHYAVRGIETQAPTSGNPRTYYGINKTELRDDDGTETVDTTFNDVTQGTVVCDNGSGVKIKVVGFGSSTTPRVAYRTLTTDTTPWTTQASATYAQFWLIEKAGADVYAVTDAGVAILGEYRVSKCPAGNDPTLAASWGNGLEVGTPEWGVVGLAAIGDSICAGKPDGPYYYNDQTKRFENVLPFLVDAPHAVNGKGLRAVPNGVVYPTHDGHLYFFDGVSVKDVSPDKGVQPRDAGYARISAIAANADEVYCVREAWQRTTQLLGLKVMTFIAGTWADVTSTVTDGVLSTGANVGTFGNAADDAILVGSSVPLEAIVVRVTRNVNAAVQSFTTPQYSNGTAGASSPFDTTFTSFTAIRDGSILSTAATSLVNTGFPPSASNAVITWTDINSFDVSTSTAITFPAPISAAFTRYWYRLKRVSATGMTANTTIDELEIVPSRQGLPVTAANDFTHRWRAGGLTEVLVAKITGNSAWQWHSIYHLDMGGGTWSATWTSGRSGQAAGAQNLGSSLLLQGRYKRARIMEGQLRQPSRAMAPVLAQPSTTKPGPILDLAPGGTWLLSGNPDNRLKKKRIKGFWVDGSFVQQGDNIRIHVQMDEVDIKCAADIFGAPWYVPVNESFVGRKMQAWLEFIDAATGDIHSPDITYVAVDYEVIDDAADSSSIEIAQNFATPETT